MRIQNCALFYFDEVVEGQVNFCHYSSRAVIDPKAAESTNH